MGGYSCCLINEVGRKKRLLETFLFTRKPKGAEDEFFFSCVLFRSFHASISTTTTLDLSLCCARKNWIKYWYLVLWWNGPSSWWWVVEEAISLPKCSEGCGCFVFSHNSETINFPPYTTTPPPYTSHKPPHSSPILPPSSVPLEPPALSVPPKLLVEGELRANEYNRKCHTTLIWYFH